MNAKEEFISNFKKRTKALSLEAIRVFQRLPKTDEAREIGRQYLRSAMSVGANYRAVCRARSKREFYAKLSITVEEADEVLFWTEVLQESGIFNNEQIRTFEKEANEILKVLSAARKNTGN